MLKLTKTLSVGLCATMLMFSCSKDMEDVTPSSTLNGDYTNAAKPGSTVVNSFDFSNLRTTDGKTWSFDVKRIGDNTSGNANVVVLGLMGCGEPAQPIALSAANVTSMTVQKEGGAVQNLSLAFGDNSNNACNMAATPNYVSFTEFDGNVKDGSVYTFTLTLSTPVQVTTANVGVRAGNDCFSGTMAGPGCSIEYEDLCGEGQGYFHVSANWPVEKITIGGKEYSVEEAVTLITSDKKEGGRENKGGIADSKAAFAQGVAVLLNRELGWISPNAYQAQLDVIENYLGGLNKLTTYDKKDLPTDNAAAKTAAGYIGDHIKCDAE